MKTKLTGIALLILSLTGCIKETLDKCPEGNVRINVYAEKFQTNSSIATQDIEEQIGKRIQFLHCVLYKDNDYLRDTVIEAISTVKEAYYPLDFSGLPFGNYNLVIVGNCSSEAMGGDYHQWGGLNILYSGIEKTADFFAALLPFTVDCDCTIRLDLKLRRLLGVVRCEMKGLPNEVEEIEVIFHNVNSQLGKDGVFSKPIRISKRFPVIQSRSRQPNNILLGIFPTLTDSPASYELKLYASGQNEALFSKVMSENVSITRNQLIELLTDFSEGEVQFSIHMDTNWEDYINGGEVEIN